MALKVKLLSHTLKPERLIAAAARQCYSKHGADTALKSLEPTDIARLVRLLLSNGHFSPFEHVSFTFQISGISRACSHQLVRHRIASYSQQSQRYVKMSGTPDVVKPKKISNDKAASALFDRLINEAYDGYTELVGAGIPKEDARFILPNAACTKLVVTMNARALLHFFRLRCAPQAQWEIRDLAFKMLKLVRKKAPIVFEKVEYGEKSE